MPAISTIPTQRPPAKPSRATHIRMILSPERWPHRRVLPLKRHRPGRSWPELGVVRLGDPKKVILTPLTMFGYLNFSDLDYRKYPTVAAMVDAGWEVD